MEWESERLAVEALCEDDGGRVALEEPRLDVGSPLARAVLGGDGGFLGRARGREAGYADDSGAVLVRGEQEGGELGRRGGDGGRDGRGGGRGRGAGGGAIRTVVGPVLNKRIGNRETRE